MIVQWLLGHRIDSVTEAYFKTDINALREQYITCISDLSIEEMDSLITEGSIADGGAAMTAYARMQFSQMSKQEADLVTAALLKYCELDTFAMVLIYEYWKHAIEVDDKKAA